MDFASCFDVSVENDGTNAFRLTLDVDEGRLIEVINNTFTPTDIFDSRYITECAFEIMEEDGIVNFFKNYQGDNRELMKRFLNTVEIPFAVRPVACSHKQSGYPSGRNTLLKDFLN